MPRRATSTSFKKGESGNTTGRPKVVGEVQALAKEQTQAAITTLIEIMNDVEEKGKTRVDAAIALLDRGHGRPHQAISMTGAAGLPVPIIVVEVCDPSLVNKRLLPELVAN